MQLLSEIYSQYKNGLFSLALSICGNRTEAEDAIHNAFLKLTKLSNFETVNNPVAYVFKAVKHASVDLHRQRQKKQAISESLFVTLADVEMPGRQLDVIEQKLMIQNSIDQLNEKQKELIILKVFSGLTFEDISKIRDEPISTISSRYQKTLKELKKNMEALAL